MLRRARCGCDRAAARDGPRVGIPDAAAADMAMNDLDATTRARLLHASAILAALSLYILESTVKR